MVLLYTEKHPKSIKIQFFLKGIDKFLSNNNSVFTGLPYQVAGQLKPTFERLSLTRVTLCTNLFVDFM